MFIWFQFVTNLEYIITKYLDMNFKRLFWEKVSPLDKSAQVKKVYVVHQEMAVSVLLLCFSK